MKVIAVIPGYNEERRIAGTVEAVRRHVDAVVVVDDGSGDRTGDAAASAGGVVFRHALNRGQGAALRTGTEAAVRMGADVVVHVDADGQHEPEFIPALLEPIRDGRVDIVFGSRFLGETPQGMPFLRRQLLHAAAWFNAFVMGIPRSVTDPQSGMRALTRRAASVVDFRQDRMAHCSEILRLATRSGLAWAEVPVRVRYSEESLAKGQKTFDAFRIVWQLFVGIFAK